MSDTAPRAERLQRTDRTDYQATSDPALLSSADRGESQLLGYKQLYELWERQHWATQDIDFTQDRIDWHERIDAEERFQRMYGLSSFFIGEQRVAAELGPMMRAVPDEDMRIFLCTQIADEARHVAFFDRFYAEVGVLESDNLQDRLEENAQYINREFGVLFDELLHSRVDRLARRARGHRDAGRGGDDLPHGHRGHARPHRPALHHGLQRAGGDAAGLRRGLHARRARRAPPRRLRRALPARHGAARRAPPRGDPAHARRGRAGRRRGAAPAVDGGRRRRADAVRRLGGRDARVRA